MDHKDNFVTILNTRMLFFLGEGQCNVGLEVLHIPRYTSPMVVEKNPRGYDTEATGIAPNPYISIESVGVVSLCLRAFHPVAISL